MAYAKETQTHLEKEIPFKVKMCSMGLHEWTPYPHFYPDWTCQNNTLAKNQYIIILKCCHNFRVSTKLQITQNEHLQKLKSYLLHYSFRDLEPITQHTNRPANIAKVFKSWQHKSIRSAHIGNHCP